LFHWIMLCGWIAFVTPEDFAWLTWRRGKEPRMNVGDADSIRVEARTVAKTSAS